MQSADGRRRVRARWGVEAPIELARLTRVVAKRFDLGAVRASRAADIAKTIPKGLLRRGTLGDFVWPEGVDPASWACVRTDPYGTRTLNEIPPEEIVNAMLLVRAESPGLEDEELLRWTADYFGIRRLGAKVKARLEAVLATLDTPDDA